MTASGPRRPRSCTTSASTRTRDAQAALAADLRERLAEASLGGPAASRERHVSRGKLLPRDRVARLLDEGSPFVEIAPLAADGHVRRRGARRGRDRGHRAGARPSGHGRLQRRDRQGRHVLPAHGQEAPARAGDRAREPAAVHLPRRLGRRVPARCRTRSSRIATTSAGSSSTRRGCRLRAIPQIAAVLGSCTAGGAYVPAMSDETVIVRDQGTIFLGGPPLVKAAIGEIVTAEELGGGELHAPPLRRRRPPRRGRRARARDRARHRRDAACAARPGVGGRRDGRRPRSTPPISTGSCPVDVNQPYDVREVIARLVDGSEFHEFKALYGETLVTGLRAAARASGRHRREQRRAVLGVGAEGRALHRAVRPARHPAAVPAEHLGLHGRAGCRGRRHREATAPRWSPPSPRPACRSSRS